jgi:ribosome-binding ATPase
MKVGIVGMPNAGKSTLFNALTEGGAQTGDYPFTTIEPNVAVAEVPDERLDALVATLDSSRVTPATIYFHDIAGLVKGASEGEGLGNQFLASIRETDAICHVVRAHALDSGVPHPDGSVDPLRDIETIETELILADYDQAERRLERVVKQARSGDKEAIAERDWLEEVRAALAEGRPVRSVPGPHDAPDAERHLQALTSKPVLYVANVDEGTVEVPPAVAAHAEANAAGAIALSARIEGELAELDAAEAAEMRESYGVEGETGLAKLVRAAYELLGLITFFTAGEGTEAVARSLPFGSNALDAAGTIHTDIADGFIKAEVIDWSELVELGSYAAARDKGTLRIEGRDYVVRDGDVVTIKV